MADEKWPEIYAKPQVWSPGRRRRRLVTPRVVNPKCPEHCSGRHELEARLVCPRCGGVGYHVTLHEWAFQERHFWYSQDPVNGTRPGETRCRDCGELWQRR